MSQRIDLTNLHPPVPKPGDPGIIATMIEINGDDRVLLAIDGATRMFTIQYSKLPTWVFVPLDMKDELTASVNKTAGQGNNGDGPRFREIRGFIMPSTDGYEVKIAYFKARQPFPNDKLSVFVR